MKKVFKKSQHVILILLGLWSMDSCTENSSASENAMETSINIEDNNPIKNTNPLEGGWYLIWGEYSGEKRDEKQPFQFKLFGDQYFSFLMKSVDGAWDYASTGTYELIGDTYRETFEFSTEPKYMGVTAEWKYQLKGDTLIMEGPTKIINQEGEEAPELAGGYNTMKEIRVRAK